MEHTDKIFHRFLTDPINDLFNKLTNISIIDKNLNIIPDEELVPVIKEINLGFNKLDKLIELIENINKDVSFEGILKFIYSTFSEFIPYNHIGIALLKDEDRILEASYGISDPMLCELPKKLMGLRAEISRTSLENIVKNGTPRIINDLNSYTKNKDANYNKILMEEGIKSSISLPLSVNEKPIGIIFFSNVMRDVYNEEHVDFLKTLSSSIAISLNKNIFIDEMLYSTLLALTKMAETRDEDTADHLDRMTAYAVKITEFLQDDRKYEEEITIQFIKGIERFSAMHDIGKVGVKDGILLKPGRLTKEEFDEMKKHVTYGVEVLKTAESNIAKQKYSMFKMGIEIVECHHEKWDGSGYPNNKSKTDIPLSARIVAVSDVFDALTSKRPYKDAYGFEESFEYVIEGSGRHFDPVIIETLKKHRNEFYELYNSFQKNKPSD
ncbi:MULTISPECIES: HD domain-containing phosphohydrolase [unclassified Sedimentibacter]|uniref:HD domain-containing phosphohydrolase n=1 Tax=unclassified Sedimentibacter TaxID=2649220 RepID=UPI0027E0175A|nr:HD domain-containing phosphohydrolase [Sedimentibacter sp. MB35-C1]WMJ77598.1 HD domain-containing protein [Sedimentibacter sp. MB35-C1]